MLLNFVELKTESATFANTPPEYYHYYAFHTNTERNKTQSKTSPFDKIRKKAFKRRGFYTVHIDKLTTFTFHFFMKLS